MQQWGKGPWSCLQGRVARRKKLAEEMLRHQSKNWSSTLIDEFSYQHHWSSWPAEPTAPPHILIEFYDTPKKLPITWVGHQHNSAQTAEFWVVRVILRGYSTYIRTVRMCCTFRTLLNTHGLLNMAWLLCQNSQETNDFGLPEESDILWWYKLKLPPNRNQYWENTYIYLLKGMVWRKINRSLNWYQTIVYVYANIFI